MSNLNYSCVIGLEIHAQLKTLSKMLLVTQQSLMLVTIKIPLPSV
jgi:Asp-tRNA(Asn)/Glu-tRNA(Gln) amidotransferase B subunit